MLTLVTIQDYMFMFIVGTGLGITYETTFCRQKLGIPPLLSSHSAHYVDAHLSRQNYSKMRL